MNNEVKEMVDSLDKKAYQGELTKIEIGGQLITGHTDETYGIYNKVVEVSKLEYRHEGDLKYLVEITTDIDSEFKIWDVHNVTSGEDFRGYEEMNV